MTSSALPCRPTNSVWFLRSSVVHVLDDCCFDDWLTGVTWCFADRGGPVCLELGNVDYDRHGIAVVHCASGSLVYSRM